MRIVGQNWLSALVVALAVANATTAYSQPDDRKSLRGLSGVLVVVEKIAPEIQQLGVTEEVVTADVELPLRQSGIRLFSTLADASATTQAMPMLDVAVYTVPNATVPLLAYLVEVSLNQIGRSLVTDELISGITWQCRELGTIGRQNISDVRQPIRDCIQKFVGDYLEANPK